MSKTLFITGASGMLGQELIPKFLEQTDYQLILLVHHTGAEQPLESFVNERFRTIAPPAKSRIKLVAGDVTKPNLGLAPTVAQDIISRATGVLHAAASTRFDLPLDEARTINVQGLKIVIQFAQQCKQLDRFGFVSTVYVAGRRTGYILETELRHDAGFVNTYEQSKYEAEQLAQEYLSKIPVSIFRLSTMIGNSQTGAVSSFTAPHQALRIMYLGLAAMVPGTPDYLIDLVSSDYTAQTITKLFANQFRPGETYHITSGKGMSFSLQELIDQTYAELGRLDIAWGKRHYPKPVISSQAAFDLFLRSAEQANTPIMSKIIGVLGHFAHQLSYPKEFDRQVLEKRMPTYSQQLPDAHSYFPKVLAYCLKTRWGKNV